jgi:hypothetical protein
MQPMIKLVHAKKKSTQGFLPKAGQPPVATTIKIVLNLARGVLETAFENKQSFAVPIIFRTVLLCLLADMTLGENETLARLRHDIGGSQ